MGEYWIAVFLFWVFVIPFLPPFDKLPAGDMLMICIGGIVAWLVVTTSTLPSTHSHHVPLSGWFMFGCIACVIYLFSFVIKLND